MECETLLVIIFTLNLVIKSSLITQVLPSHYAWTTSDLDHYFKIIQNNGPDHK